MPCPVNPSLFHPSHSSILETFIHNPVSGLYTSDPNAPFGQQAGLREYYELGLYSYCGFVSTINATSTPSTVNATSPFVNSSSTPNPSIGPGRGSCSNHTFARPFTPYVYITSDMLSNYTILSNNFIPDTTFRDSGYLRNSGKAAYWTLLLGTICGGFAIVTYVFQLLLSFSRSHPSCDNRGIAKNHLTFFLSAIFSLTSAILLLIASSTYSILIKKCEAINSILLTVATTDQKIPLGIVVSGGTGIYLIWAACVCMVLSVIPYFIRYIDIIEFV